jgi:cytochrome c oxidase subunit 2
MIERLVPQAASYARDVDWLFTLIFVTVGFWFLVAEVVFFWFLWRFRRREGVPALHITGTVNKEKRWISIPHALIIICDVVLIIGTMYVWAAVRQDLPPAEQKVRVIAQQWAWTFVQPGPDGQLDTADDITTLDELHVQADTTYHFELTSKDVVHSFSIPVFRLKQDAVPGRVITGWFRPTTPGTYDIQCAEICGIGHALMPATLTIETPDRHQEWMRSKRA